MKPTGDFNKSKAARDGLQRYCRDCQRAKTAEWYAANRQRAIESSRQWNLDHPERVKEADRRRNATESRKQWKRGLYANTEYGERSRAASRSYRERNREAVAAGVSSWRAANPERVAANKRRWAAEHPEYTQAHARLKASRRRATKRAATVGRFTVQDLASRLDYYGGACWICGAPWEHWDHVKPLAKGGPHMLANLRPACAKCNNEKGSQWPFPPRRNNE